jgi:hypothetical protein
VLTGFYIRAREAIASLSYLSAAVIGAAIGGLIILLGGHFHIGSWFLAGTQAYVPAILSGAVTALLIRYLLKRA